MSVESIYSVNQFTEILNDQTPTRLVIVDFTAKWCGPCKVIGPIFTELSSKYPHCRFLKVDVDDAQDVAKQEGVSSMPTFKFYKQGKCIESFSGANPQKLEQLIKDLQGSNDDAASKLGVSGYVDITNLVNKKQVESLNLNSDHDIGVVFTKDNKTIVESDTDEQLIITLGFSQAVKLHSIKFHAPLSHAPRRVKLFTNYSTLGFDDASSNPAVQELELTEADYNETAVTNLRFVKFQNVTTLSIFIEDNLGGEEITKLQQLTLIGTPVLTTKMGEFQNNSNH